MNWAQRLSQINLGEAYALSNAGVKLERRANQESAQMMYELADFYYYEAGKQKSMKSAEGLRAGDSNRLEWWNAVEPKERLLAEIMQRDQKLRFDAMGMKAKFTVNFMQNLSKNITHPRTD